MYFIQTNTTKLERNSGSPNNLPAVKVRFDSVVSVGTDMSLIILTKYMDKIHN